MLVACRGLTPFCAYPLAGAALTRLTLLHPCPVQSLQREHVRHCILSPGCLSAGLRPCCTRGSCAACLQGLAVRGLHCTVQSGMLSHKASYQPCSRTLGLEQLLVGLLSTKPDTVFGHYAGCRVYLY